MVRWYVYFYKEVSVYNGGLNLGFLYLVIRVFWDKSAMTHLQFVFSVPREYVHKNDVSAMMCFRIVFSVPDWYVYFPVPDRYLYYKTESVYDGGLNLGFLYSVITGILGRVSYDVFAIWFFCTL